MRTQLLHRAVCLFRTACILLVAGTAAAEDRGFYRAFSLAVARERLAISRPPDTDLSTLGGITRVAGLVQDEATGDLIVVGAAVPRESSIQLDDLVVALRAVLLLDEYPRVSIDRTADPSHGHASVVFRGGLKNTHYGLQLLAADVALKKIALGLLPAEPWGVTSYHDLVVTELQRKKRIDPSDNVVSRFWFYPASPAIAVRDGVCAIRDLDIGVRTELVSIGTANAPAVTQVDRDVLGERFAAQVTAAFEDLGSAYPEVARVKTLLDLAALARGLQALPSPPDMKYWLLEHTVAPVPTPREYALLSRAESIRVSEAAGPFELSLDGGIALDPIVERLRAGDVTAMRDAVLRSRPQPSALCWTVPLTGWSIPGAASAAPNTPSATSRHVETSPGFSLRRSLKLQGVASPNTPLRPAQAGNSRFDMPVAAPSIHDRLRPQSTSQAIDGVHLPAVPRVGGVMLGNAGRVSGDNALQLDLRSGGFSLIVQGEQAVLAPGAYRKFVTALWAVYFSEQDPGISIDPIAPGLDRHLVRYIGKVVNTDLGRVMREADYDMKRWAVGVEHPGVRGFRSVDALWAASGSPLLGSRRFWFIPESMRFKSGDGMILFESGRIVLKTEILTGSDDPPTSAGDRAYADYFTSHYGEIATQHPIYNELFDYAKLVSLAKYLKESGAPLFWFLMANQDQVLREDSPGTVEAFAKGSDYFRNMQIEGGVDLSPRAQYVLDPQAMEILQAASQAAPPTADPRGPGPTARKKDVGRSMQRSTVPYTVVPQNSLTSGRDRRGIRYQTDVAIRNGTQPGIELVRYYDPARPQGGEFGEGWRLLSAYRVEPEGSETTVFRNATLPTRMAVVNQLNGDRETLAFDTETYSIAGYVPEGSESALVGLFILSDGSFRLADKIGNEFALNDHGQLVEMSLSDDYRVTYEYVTSLAGVDCPLSLRPEGKERVAAAGVSLPQRMQLHNAITGESEGFVFCDTLAFVGYVPESRAPSRYALLAVLTDGSFRLADRKDNEFAFDAWGDFQSLKPSAESPLVHSMSLGRHRVELVYGLDAQAAPRVMAVQVHDADGGEPTVAAAYRYDAAGRLSRIGGADSW